MGVHSNIQYLVTLVLVVIACMLLATIYMTKIKTLVALSPRKNYRFDQLTLRQGSEDEQQNFSMRVGESEDYENGLNDNNFRAAKDTDFIRAGTALSPTTERPSTKRTTKASHPVNASSPCSPRKNIAFLKTHKTGSSTIQNILYRYGDNHALNFALPRHGSNYFGVNSNFKSSYVKPIPRGHQHNILANHGRYNREEFQALMPADTIYVTILRHPATQYESLYNYYNWDSLFKIPFEEFVKDPQTFYRKFNKTTFGLMKHALKNPNLYDLGVEPGSPAEGVFDDELVNGAIHSLERDFHLVLILEYMEESVILLKELMCWDWEEVIFFRVNARSNPTAGELSPSSEKTLVDFNKGDWMLYNYFNDSLWRKISEYGVARMAEDKRVLRQKIEKWKQFCIKGNRFGDFRGTTITKFELTEEAEDNLSCKQLVRSSLKYLNQLNSKMDSLVPVNATER